MAEDIWPTVHAERRALAQDLAGLTPEQWATPSLCQGWSVHDVLAHQVTTARTTPLTFLARMAKAGFSFPRFAEAGVAAGRAATPEQTLADFRAVQSATTSPPGPKTTWMGEALVHSEDIRRPLGIPHAYPPEAVARVIRFYAGSNALIGGKSRVAGVTLVASDADFAHGDGPRVEGPLVSLMLATTGRRAALDDLSGPGVAVLRERP